ncbi:MAG: helix-turn-helix transcriptional regulator [Pseudomonadota bacterium]
MNRLQAFFADLEAIETLEELRTVLDAYSRWAHFEFIHCGVCQIGNTRVKDNFYSRPITGGFVGVEQFPDHLKTAVCDELLHQMKPIGMRNHRFVTCDDSIMDPVRNAIAATGGNDAIFIPGWHGSTMFVGTIYGDYEAFKSIQATFVSVFNAAVAEIFRKWPSLVFWPEKYKLTNRESQILQLSSCGSTELEISVMLNISPNTVRNHIENAKEKMNARNKAHAVAIAAQSGEINSLSKVKRRKG